MKHLPDSLFLKSIWQYFLLATADKSDELQIPFFTGPQIFYLILGMVVAFIVSVYAIRFLMGYIRKHDFKFFGYYRIVLGAIVLVYFGITAFIG